MKTEYLFNERERGLEDSSNYRKGKVKFFKSIFKDPGASDKIYVDKYDDELNAVTGDYVFAYTEFKDIFGTVYKSERKFKVEEDTFVSSGYLKMSYKGVNDTSDPIELDKQEIINKIEHKMSVLNHKTKVDLISYSCTLNSGSLEMKFTCSK